MTDEHIKWTPRRWTIELTTREFQLVLKGLTSVIVNDAEINEAVVLAVRLQNQRAEELKRLKGKRDE